ncbi:MAG: ribonucleoside-diphosphate reductase alpha chain [Myxococcota bacterium]|jgi:ribonucleoside-diphosphate reductase alpha chain
MTGRAFAASAALAERLGPFAEWEANQAPMDAVLKRHAQAASEVTLLEAPLKAAIDAAWEEALERGAAGYRNAQVTLLAPTGTISFMMDCDTTGVEPELALIKTRTLVGGGVLQVVNQAVPRALEALGCGPRERAVMLSWLETHHILEGAPGLDPAHLPIFETALGRGRRIPPEGHLGMMAAVQPLLSGAISKTINLPADATVDQIEALITTAWRSGVKSVTVYRDGSKRTQPIQTGHPLAHKAAVPSPVRRRLPDVRQAITHKFSIGGHEGYLTVGLYDDGSPGELFLVMAKEDSVISGLVNSFATSVSMALQYRGAPGGALEA